MRLELEIAELTLIGFRAQDRYRIGGALRTELARMLESRALTAALPPSRDSVDGGSFTAASHPEAVGRQIARAVYGGLR